MSTTISYEVNYRSLLTKTNLHHLEEFHLGGFAKKLCSRDGLLELDYS